MKHLLIFASCLWFNFALAQQPEKAQKYHELLLKRPDSSVLFERFCEAWLENSNTSNLEAFLKKQTEAGTAADYLLQARWQLREGNETAAQTTFQSLVEQFPEDGQAWLAKAKLEVRRNQTATAIHDLKKAIATELSGTDQEAALLSLGRQLAKSGEGEQALNYWQQLLTKNPDDDTYQDVIDLQIRENLTEQAITTARQWIATIKDPVRIASAKLRLAEIHAIEDQLDSAKKLLTQVFAQSGSNSWIESEVLSTLETLYRNRDDLTNLKSIIDNLVADHPGRPSLLRMKARLLAESGNAIKANQTFKQLLEITPGDLPTREAYVDMLEILDLYDEAIEQTKQLANNDPETPDWSLRLANLYYSNLDKPNAGKSVAEYLEKSDGSPSSYLTAARALERFGLYGATEDTYRQMVEAFPEGREALAGFLHRQLRKKEAIELWLEVAAEGDTLRIARILSSRSEHDAAYQILKEKLPEHRTDAGYLTQLCQEALTVSHAHEVIEQSRNLILLSKNDNQLSEALQLSGSVIRAANEQAGITRELQALPDPDIYQLCLLAELYQLDNRLDDAEAILKDSTNELAIPQLIRLFTRSKQWLRAANFAETQLDKPGGRTPRNLERIILLFERSGKLNRAMTYTTDWQKLSSGRPAPFIKEAEIAEKLGDHTHATEVLEKAVLRFPNELQVRSRLAQTYSMNGQPGKAEQEYRRLYELSDTDASRIRRALEWSEAASRVGRLNLVMEEFLDRRRRSPDSILPVLILSKLHGARKNRSEETRYLKEAIRIRPKTVELYLQLASAQEAEGNIEAAKTTLESARSFDRSKAALKRLAGLYLRTGNEALGLRLMMETAAVAMDPNELEAIADRLASSAGWEPTLELLEPVLKDNPDDYRLNYLYGFVLEQLDRPKEATETYLNVLSLSQELGRKVLERKIIEPNYLRQIFPNPNPDDLPDGTIFLLEQQKAEHILLTDRDYYISTPWGNQPAQASKILLPLSHREAHHFALVRIRSIAQADSNFDYEAATARLAVANIPSPSIILKTPPSTIDIDQTFTTAAQHAKWVCSNGLFQPDNSKHIAAYSALKEKHPLPALLAALLSEKNRTSGQTDFVAKSLREILPQIDKADESWALPLMYAFGENKGIESDSKLKQLIIERLALWRQRAESTKAKALWFSTITSLESPEQLVTRLDREFTELRQNPSTFSDTDSITQIISTQNGIYGMPAIIQPIQFPPTELPNFPSWVLTALHGGGPVANLALSEKFSDNEANKLIARANDPTLKLLIAGKLKRHQTAGNIVEEIKANPDATADDLLTAAAYARQQKDKNTAEMLESRATNLVDEKWSLRLDAARIHRALESNQPDGPTESALLRLANSKLDNNGKKEIRHVAAQLQLTKLVAGSVGVAPKSNRSRNTAGLLSTPEARLKKLAEHNRPKAIQLADRLLLAQSRKLIHFPDQFQYWTMQQLCQVIQDSNLTVGVIDAIKKKAAEAPVNTQTLLHLAISAEFLTQIRSMHDAYEKTLEADPNNYLARARLFGHLARVGSSRAYTIANETPDDQLSNFGRSLNQFCNNHRNQDEWDANLLLADQVVKFLPSKLDLLKDSQISETQWIIQILDTVGNRSGQMPNYLFPGPPYLSNRNDRRIQNQIKLRANTITSLAEQALEITSLSNQAFVYLQGAGQRSETELINAAEKAIQLINNGSTPQILHHQGHYGLTRHQLTPSEYLVRQSWLSRKKPYQFDPPLPELEGKYIKSMQSLYTCSEDSFVETAKQFATNHGRHAIITMAWVDRGGPADISDLLLEPYENGNIWASHNSEPLWRYAEHLAKQDKYQQCHEFLSGFTELKLGPKDQQHELIERIARRGNRQWTPTMRKAYDWGQTFSIFSQSPWLIGPIIRQTEAFNLQQHTSLPFRISSEIPDKFESAETAVAVLKGSGFLQWTDQFSPIPYSDDSYVSLKVLSGLKSSGMKVRNDVLDTISDLPPSFGISLVDLVLSNQQSTKAEAWYKHYQHHLEAMDDESKSYALTILQKSISKSNLPPLPAEMWQTQPSNRALTLIDKIRNANRFSDLNLTYSQIDDELGNALKESLKTDPIQAAKDFTLAVKLVKDGISSGKISRNYLVADYINQTVRQTYYNSPGLEILAFTMHLLEDPDVSPNFVFEGYWRDKVSEAIYDDFKSGKDPIADRFAVTFRKIASQTAGLRPESLAYLGSLVHHHIEGPNFEIICKRLETFITDGEHPELARAFLVALRFHDYTHQWAKGKRPMNQKQSVEEKYHIDAIQDTSLSLRTRVLLAYLVISYQRESFVPSISGVHQVTDWLTDQIPGNTAFIINDALLTEAAIALCSVERQDNWQEIAQKLFECWGHCEQRAMRNQIPARSWNMGNQNCMEISSLLFALNEQPTINRFLNKYGDKVTKNPAFYYRLLRYNQSELAANLFEQEWPTMDRFSHYEKHHGEAPAGLEAFLAKLPSDEMRFLAEANVTALADHQVPNADQSKLVAVTPTSFSRLAAMAPRFREIEWTNEAMKLRALEIMAVGDDSADILYDEISEAAKSVDSRDIITKNRNYLEARGAMWLAYGEIAGGIRRNDLTPLARHFRGLNQSSNNHTRGWVYWEILERVQRNLKTRWGNHPEKIAEQMIPICKDYLMQNWSYESGYTGRILAINLNSHAVLDRMKQHELWWASHSDDKREKMAKIMKSNSYVFGTARWIYGSDNGYDAPVEKRVEHMKRTFSAEIFRNSYNWKPKGYHYLTFNHLLTEAESLEHFLQWKDEMPRGGWAAAELMQMYARAGQLETSLQLFDESWQQAVEASKEPAWFARIVIGKAKALKIAEKPALAKAALDEFPASAPDSLVAQKQQLQNELDQ